MRIDKTHIRKGSFLTGGAHRAAFMAKRAPLPTDLREFENAAAEADRLAAQGIYEVERRLSEARKRLEEIRAMARKNDR